MKRDTSPQVGSGEKPPLADAKEAPPPGYEATADTTPPDITAAFAQLNLNRKENTPTPEECIAHLKLLEAMNQVREDVGATDGLYGLFDRLADAAPEADRKQMLAKMREKRWATFVVQATRRFEKWFQTLEPGKSPLRLVQMAGSAYEEIHSSAPPLKFTADNLPPLDVVMVWHAFLLNPRRFLGDCIRHNKIGLWRAGMPWQPIVASIDNSTFAYNPGTAAQDAFTKATHQSWNLLDEAPSVDIECPQCRQALVTELTTCTRPEDWSSLKTAGELGTGFTDASFKISCVCGFPIDHQTLRVQRFQRDLQSLLVYKVPMPGTILSLDGLTPPAQSISVHNRSLTTNNTFASGYPNRILSAGGATILAQVVMSSGDEGGSIKAAVRVDDIRKGMESILRDTAIRRQASPHSRMGAVTRQERIAIRRMMSCYWDNASIFSMDLAGAVIRQNVFMQKMHEIDWLHSPALRNTMQRLIEKYKRFFQIMRDHPDHVAVPTLDVDLAWHTHQLDPVSYRKYSVALTKIFIDHDDKIDENKLSTSFEWTSKTYEKTFGAVYSECTCWYCEAIRESHTARLGRLFKSKDNVDVELDRLHAAGPSNPHKSPHISAHNAIRAEQNPDHKTAAYVQKQQLERSYQRAVRRARKEGRAPPERDAYYFYPYWGIYYPMPVYAPYMGDPCLNGGMYPANPACANFGAGAIGNCAAGSCGGGVAAGGCAGGACAGGAAGGSCGGAGGGGCGGGGGGGCGGGGGGCGGGGGGGCGGGGGG